MALINVAMTRDRLTEIGRDLAEIHNKIPDSDKIGQQLRRADTMICYVEAYDQLLRQAGEPGLPILFAQVCAIRDELKHAHDLALLAEDWYKTEKRENY